MQALLNAKMNTSVQYILYTIDPIPSRFISLRRNATLAGLLVCSLILCGCAGKGAATEKGAGKKGDLAVPVTVATVAQKDVPVDVQVIGNVEAYSTITVKAQVGGELINVNFKEGDYVKKGDLLFSIDPRPLQAQLSQAEANSLKAKAMIGQAEANLARDIANEKYLRAQAQRMARLVKEGIISKEQGEQAESSADATGQTVMADRAAIESAKAEMTAAKAAADNLRVQLGYTDIRSPLDGRTGNQMIKQGNVVSANGLDLVTINQVTPIYVTFSVPESKLAGVKRYMLAGKLPVIVTPQDDESVKQTGMLTFVDNNVDTSTGTIKLKGTFENTEKKLWPGEFVRVVLRLTTQANASVVPNQAVQTGQDGSFVYVVKKDNTVESRPVITGSRMDQDMVIDKGLDPGETVVTEGQLRLAPGSRVQVRDGSAPGGRRKKAT